jgi:hypothetical protein
MMKPRPAGCGAAIAQGAIPLGLDVVGAIPAFGNVVSATAAGARAVNGIVAYGGAAYGIATGLPDSEIERYVRSTRKKLLLWSVVILAVLVLTAIIVWRDLH